MAFNFASGRNFIEMLAHTVRDEKRAPLKTLAWEADTVLTQLERFSYNICQISASSISGLLFTAQINRFMSIFLENTVYLLKTLNSN